MREVRKTGLKPFVLQEEGVAIVSQSGMDMPSGKVTDREREPPEAAARETISHEEGDDDEEQEREGTMQLEGASLTREDLI
ncbi:unnamed protein product [Linum trigynum]|uniref:Uncharacterized protein n=1 Tax=Linum trigynum TaxID=586398 RepID=A0AAV2GNX0_9ROSI